MEREEGRGWWSLEGWEGRKGLVGWKGEGRKGLVESRGEGKEERVGGLERRGKEGV